MDSMELKKQQRLSISDYRIDESSEYFIRNSSFSLDEDVLNGEVPNERTICQFIDKCYLCWDCKVEEFDSYRIEHFENGVKVKFRYTDDMASEVTTVILLQEYSGNYYAIMLDDECDNPCTMWIIIKR